MSTRSALVRLKRLGLTSSLRPKNNATIFTRSLSRVSRWDESVGPMRSPKRLFSSPQMIPATSPASSYLSMGARCKYKCMAHNFGSLVFTPVVKALQEKYGSRRQYARMEEGGSSADRLGPEETRFIAERDTFYMATIGSSGWPYIQHRGGPKGFLKVIDDHTVAFDDFRGNKQYISTGNIATNDRVALIMVDYPHQARLKFWGARRFSKATRQKSGSNGCVTEATMRSLNERT